MLRLDVAYRSYRPAWMPLTRAPKAGRPNASTGPFGSFESRKATTDAPSPTSTQFPPSWSL